MSQTDYEYGGMMAEFWDLFRGDTSNWAHHFFNHLLPGGRLVMPLMPLYTGDSDALEVVAEWSHETIRPEDGATIRRWSRSRIDRGNGLEHTEARYEILRDGIIVASESRSRSPATRSYTQAQAIALYTAAGFTDLRLTSDFTQEPAQPGDATFCIWGTRPSVLNG